MVVVPVKHVALLDDEFKVLDGPRIDPATIEYELNEWDNFSLEGAVQIKDASVGREVVAVTVAEEALLSALA